MGKKKVKQKAVATPERSETIKQCVIYVQQIAAYDAGFDVDQTADSDFAAKGGHIKKARRAMLKLLSLSPYLKAGAAPLTAPEVRAKAGVLAVIYGLRKGETPDPIEAAYVRFFAGEVSDFVKANHPAAS